MTSIQLPNGIQVFERGWLSSNNILFLGSASSALVDSGYSTHAELTAGLVSAALQQRPLDLLPSSAVIQNFKPSFRPAMHHWSRHGTPSL